ncbi:hypothetical protein N4Q65_00320 [Salmonella enterica subsp. enterica serovar Pomona]
MTNAFNQTIHRGDKRQFDAEPDGDNDHQNGNQHTENGNQHTDATLCGAAALFFAALISAAQQIKQKRFVIRE